MIVTWTEFVDLSRHVSFQFGNVVRANGRDYCVVTSDAAGLLLWPADASKEPKKDAPTVTMRWHDIKALHIY